MPTKRVTVHYRRAVGRNLADLDFRACFDAGLAGQIGGVTLSSADASRVTTSSDGYRMCLLSPSSDANFCFGEVAVFREGDVPVAAIDREGQMELRTIPLAGNEEAVRGTSYFMARGPHLAILHHDSSTRFLDEYFRWLFRQPIGVLPQDDIVSLQSLINAGGHPVALRAVRSLIIRAEAEVPNIAAPRGGRRDERPQTFARMIDRQPLSEGNVRTILRAMGMSDGSLGRFRNQDYEDLEFELLVKRREGNRIAPLPDHLVEGVVNDGLDRAAEFETEGARRRGDAVIASFPGQIDYEGAYYDLNSVRALLWAALGSWADQELI
jgi:hypothetical protein